MRRGFTILELLVASMLLGMLMTILTMIFSQSSIAWRTGVAGVANMDEAREKISNIRHYADNAYPDMEGQLMNVKSVFSAEGKVVSGREAYLEAVSPEGILTPDDNDVNTSFDPGIGCANGKAKGQSTYVVNVMSKGPDSRDDVTYDDIWSFPDDPELWCD